MKVYAVKSDELAAEAVVNGEKVKLANFEGEDELNKGITFLAGLVTAAFFDLWRMRSGEMEGKNVPETYGAFLSRFVDFAMADFEAVLEANAMLPGKRGAKA